MNASLQVFNNDNRKVLLHYAMIWLTYAILSYIKK